MSATKQQQSVGRNGLASTLRGARSHALKRSEQQMQNGFKPTLRMYKFVLMSGSCWIFLTRATKCI